MKVSKKEENPDKVLEEWEILRLGDESIGELIMGQSPPSSTYNNKGIGLPFLQGNAEFGEIYPEPTLSCSQPIKIAEKNDILLSVRAPVGDVNITPYRSCIGRGLTAIRPKTKKLDYLFLFYYLKFVTRKFQLLSMGSTFKAIRKEEIEKFKISLPPLSEQKKIAEILFTVDEAIQKVDEAIAKTERLKRGLMQQLLTNGIGHEKFKFSKELGCEIPEEWEVVVLKDIVENMKRGPFGGSIKKEIFVPRGYKVYEQKNVINNDFSMGNYYISEKKYNELKSFAIKEEDILLTGAGTIGKIAVVPKNFEPGIINQALIKITLDKRKILIHYFYNLLNYTSFRNKVLGSSHGATMKNISSVRDLKNIKIPLPSLSEQRSITKILNTINKKLELERERKEKLERIKKGLMNDLLTGNKRVKMEVS